MATKKNKKSACSFSRPCTSAPVRESHHYCLYYFCYYYCLYYSCIYYCIYESLESLESGMQ